MSERGDGDRPGNGSVLEPSRRVPVVAETDVLVVGGGSAGVGAAVGLEVEGLDPLSEWAAELERESRPAAADDEAAQAPRLYGRGEEQRRGADVGPDGVRVFKPERVGYKEHELAHRPGGKQRLTPLGVTEPG